MIKYVLLVFILIGCGSSPNQNSQNSQSPNPPTSGKIIKTLFDDTCVKVDYVHYPSPNDLGSYFHDTRNFITFWDVRYVSPNITSVCNGTLYFSSEVNLNGPHYPDVHFGGPQSTLIYKLHNAYPWRDGNNLAIQVNMDEPEFNRKGGGGIAFNFFMHNIHTQERLNYVISIYTLGSAWDSEQKDILYDTSTDTKFISTTIDINNIYTTISQHSQRTNAPGYYNFFRVNITQENISKIVQNPEYWYISFIGIQYELEESLGQGVVSTHFNGFSAYVTNGAI